MINKDLKERIELELTDLEEETTDPYIYFDLYYSSKPLDQANATEFVERTLRSKEIIRTGEFGESGIIVRIQADSNSSSPLLFWEMDNQEWLVCYSSNYFDGRDRERLSKAEGDIGWLLSTQIDSKIVDDLYDEFSPKEDQVNIERKWDPYWIYERGRDVPEELQRYYEDNMQEFVEQEVQFNVKSPGWLVDQTLEEGVKEELLEKSNVSKTMFTFDLGDKSSILSDGGTTSDEPQQSGVTVRQEGQIVHRSGNAEATYTLVDEIESRDNLHEKFEEVVPIREYDTKENGIRELVEYHQGKVLKVEFIEKSFDEEASLTLSNLLTVGQDDVDIHGVVQSRNNLEFFTESYTVFDNGEYEILFTTPNDQYRPHATLYIKPTSATVNGLVYIYKKLKEKFDPRARYDIVDEYPETAYIEEVSA